MLESNYSQLGLFATTEKISSFIESALYLPLFEIPSLDGGEWTEFYRSQTKTHLLPSNPIYPDFIFKHESSFIRITLSDDDGRGNVDYGIEFCDSSKSIWFLASYCESHISSSKSVSIDGGSVEGISKEGAHATASRLLSLMGAMLAYIRHKNLTLLVESKPNAKRKGKNKTRNPDKIVYLNLTKASSKARGEVKVSSTETKALRFGTQVRGHTRVLRGVAIDVKSYWKGPSTMKISNKIYTVIEE